MIMVAVLQSSPLPDLLDGVLILAGGYGSLQVLATACDHMDRVRIRRSGRKEWW